MLRHITLVLCIAGCVAAAQPETIDLRVENKPLFTLIERIAQQCDAGLSVQHAVQDRLDAEVTINARDARWADAVELLRQQYHLELKLVGGRLVVDDADAALRRLLVTVTYDIRPLTQTKVARPGPALDIPQPGGTGSSLLPPIDPEEGPDVASFIELIRGTVSPAIWDDRVGTAIEEYNGDVVITQTPEVHRRIAALLRNLETGLTRQVQMRLWRLPAESADGPPVIDRDALAARIKGLGAPALVFVTGDDQQSHGWAGVQRNAVLDLDVVQSRMDPIVSILSAGLSLDVHPLITRAGILLTIRFTAAAAIEVPPVPMRDAAGKVITSIDQPALDHDAVRCSVVVPDGGAAILRFGDRAYAIQAAVYQAAPTPP